MKKDIKKIKPNKWYVLKEIKKWAKGVGLAIIGIRRDDRLCYDCVEEEDTFGEE